MSKNLLQASLHRLSDLFTLVSYNKRSTKKEILDYGENYQFHNRPFDERTIVFGEVGLSGEVRAVNMPEQRVAEAKKLGFETCIVPEVSLDSVKSIGGIKIIGVKSINEAIGLIE